MEHAKLDLAAGARAIRESAPLIEIEDLTKVYGTGDITVYALRGVGMQVEAGEFVAIMGPSGSGKSTLMNILGCLDRPGGGRYVLDDEDVSELGKNELARVRNRMIGFIFQSYNLLPRLSALKNVMPPTLYGAEADMFEGGRQQRAQGLLEMVGLGDRVHHRPNEMSGGQQQRVAIARALVNTPSIILADEPTGNLDTRSSGDIMGLLGHLHAGGTTILMVTHDPETATFADRVISLRDGEIVSDERNEGSRHGDQPKLNGDGEAR